MKNLHARTRAHGRTRAVARVSIFLLAVLLSACDPAPAPHSPAHTGSHPHGEADVPALTRAYEERVRLGLGSPFRTMEIAARDERLPEDVRAELLPRLFEQIAAGETYQIGATLPIAHYRVISSALNSAHDPRIAELATNLAYEIAVAEKTVTPELQYAAASTAALLRDRALARWDAQRIRELARARDQAPHTLVPALRAARQLLVEQPLLPSMNAAAEAEAARLAMLLAGGVRQAARTPGERVAQTSISNLTDDVAEKILQLPQQPPQSAVVIALRAAQLPFDARNEEELVAQLARASAHEHPVLAAQRVAIALRPFAQEKIWHAGV